MIDTTVGRRGLLAGAVAALAAGSACGRREVPDAEPPVKDATKLTVGLTYIPNIQFSPFYVALEEQLFDAGLKVTLRHHGQQEDLFGALLAGQEDVVFASADEALVAASKGQDLRTFATAYQTYPIEILSLRPASDLSALKGAKLGIPGHYGSNYYAALVALHSAGLTDADVELVDIGYTQTTALTTGKVDFIAAFSNNELVQLTSQGKQVTRLPISPEPVLVGPSLVTQGNKVPSEHLKSIAQAMVKAEKMILDDPAVALDATAKQVPTLVDPAQRKAAEAVLAATSKLWLVDGEPSAAVNEQAFARMGEALKTAGIITTIPAEPVVKLD